MIAPASAGPRTSVVTGGGSGIGRATAKNFASIGDHVIVADINDAGANETKMQIEARGGTASVFHVDVADELSVTALLKAAERIGPTSALVNCAGILQNGSRVEDMDLVEHDRVWNVNYRR